MLPINLEGEELWERQKYLNKITNEAFSNNKKISDVKALEELSDVDRLFKIDLAIKERNVDYILENLKSLDSLYVARALRADWLFRDDQFGDIVNPEFLEGNVFPQMAPKTIAKFLLKLRIHLRQPKRCENFFLHYEHTNKQLAFGFLLHCSEDFLISLKERYSLNEIEPELLKRLTRNRPRVAESFFSTSKGEWSHIIAIKHLVTNYGEIFLNIVERNYDDWPPYCGRLGTRVCNTIIKHHKQRILAKPAFYDGMLKWDMLKACLNENEIKSIAKLIVTSVAEGFFNNNALFMKYIEILNKEIIYSFAKEVFNEKWPDEEFELSEGFYNHNWHNKHLTEEQREQWALQHIAANTEFLVNGYPQMYKLYAYVKFDLAFPELVKLIRSEKNCDTRHGYFEVLITSSRLDQKAIYRLMNYYVQKHLNEPLNVRGSFIKEITSKKRIYNFDEKSWALISELFNSIRLFEEPSDYSIPSAVEGAILYHIINGIEIPENVKFKFLNNFSTMDYVQGTVSQENEQKIYDFLYIKMANSIKDYYIFDQSTLYKLLSQHFKLIHSWNRKLTDYPDLVALVKRIINNGNHGYQFYQCNLSDINEYDEVFARELLKYKHTPAVPRQIRKKEKDVLSTMTNLDIQSLIRSLSSHYPLLSKVRIYFKNDLWSTWIAEIKEYFNTWQTSQAGIEQMVTALYWLLDSKEAEQFFQSYIPKEAKMDMTDPNLSSVQKFVAKHMHLARPTISFEFVSAFLKGDYMKFASPSLYSWCSQVPLAQMEGAIKIIIDNPVSIQKHGIRLALKRMRVDQIKPLFAELYRQTKNVSIKEVIFNSTFFVLTTKQNLPNIIDWAELLKSFIDSLSGNDDRSIYTYIHKLQECPFSVQPMLCEASWKCMLRAPDNSVNRSFKETILPLIVENIDRIDEIFLHNILHDYFMETLIEEKSILTNEWSTLDTLHWTLAENYFIKCKSSEIQDERIAKILSLIMTGSLNLWHELKKYDYIVKQKLKLFCESLYRTAFVEVRSPHNVYINPVKIFNFIHSKLEHLPSHDVFYQCTTLKLIVMLIDALYAVRNESGDSFSTLGEDEYNARIFVKVFTRFGSSCITFFENWKAEYSSFSNEIFHKCIRLFLEVFIRNLEMVYTEIYFAKGFIAEGRLDHLEVSLRLIPEGLPLFEYLPYKTPEFFEDVKAAYLQVVNEARCSDCAALHILLDMKFNDNRNREFEYSPQSSTPA